MDASAAAPLPFAASSVHAARDHPPAAIGQHDQQLRPAAPPRPAEHRQAQALHRVTVTGHRDLGHPRSPRASRLITRSA